MSDSISLDALSKVEEIRERARQRKANAKANAKSGKRKLVSFNPETFITSDSYDPREFCRPVSILAVLSGRSIDPHDLLEDEEKRQLEITSFPSSLQTPLNKIRSRVVAPSCNPPADSTVTTHALQQGVTALYSHPAIIAAREVRERVYQSDFNDPTVEQLLADWVSVARVEVAVAGSSFRKVVYVPESLKNELGNLARDLGVARNALAALCCAVSLVGQKEMQPKVAAEWAGRVETFLRSVDRRAYGTKLLTLLDRLDDPQVRATLESRFTLGGKS